MKLSRKNENRIHFLDEARGFAVFLMIFYHAFYLLYSAFGLKWAYDLFVFFMPVEPIFAALFMFVSGISTSLSRNNLKRGLILLGVALGFTAVTAFVMPALGFVECEIYFGILHFLSCSIIIFSLCRKPLSKISPFAGMLVCTVLYPFFGQIENGILRYGSLAVFQLPDSLYETDWLMPFGIHSDAFFSADYFPLLPNIFIFLAGAFFGMHLVKNGFPKWSYPKRNAFFGFLGRNALIIYIAHMPVIFAVSYGIELIINMFK